MDGSAHTSPRRAELLHEILRADWSRFDAITGLRAGFFVVTPVILGAATGYLFQGLYATLGANFLTSTEGSGPGATRFRMLALACVLEPAVFAAGTLCGTVGLLAIPLVGLGIFAFLTIRTYQGWSQVGLMAAIIFAVGIGLPGASTAAAVERLWTSMAGALWILLGVGIQMAFRPTSKVPLEGGAQKTTVGSRHVHPLMMGQLVHSEAVRQALATGIAASTGLAIGLALHLPRDIWILITVIIAIRQGIGPTIDSTAVLVAGTAIGSVIAAAITLETSNLAVLVAFMSIFAFAMNSSRLVSPALFQAFVTPFLIILLNIIFPGNWEFAIVRIIDVAIGGGLAIAAVYILSWEADLEGPGRKARG